MPHNNTYRYTSSIAINETTTVGDYSFSSTENKKRSSTLWKKKDKDGEQLTSEASFRTHDRTRSISTKKLFFISGEQRKKKKSKFGTFSLKGSTPSKEQKDLTAYCGKDDGETQKWKNLVEKAIADFRAKKETFAQ